MHRVVRCFLCNWDLSGTEVVAGEARSGVPAWKSVPLCGTCAKKVKELGEVCVMVDDESMTVRARGRLMNEEELHEALLDEVVDFLCEGFKP